MSILLPILAFVFASLIIAALGLRFATARGTAIDRRLAEVTGSAEREERGPRFVVIKDAVRKFGSKVPISPSEMVGNWRGSPPAAITPRATASTSSGIERWQLLNSLPETAMPPRPPWGAEASPVRPRFSWRARGPPSGGRCRPGRGG